MKTFKPITIRPSFDKSKPTLVYGFGIAGIHYLGELISEGCEIAAIFDRNPLFHSYEYKNIPVSPIEEIENYSRDFNVIIAVGRPEEVEELLFKLGFKHIFHIELGCHDAPFYAQSWYERSNPLIVYGLNKIKATHIQSLLDEGVQITAIIDPDPSLHDTMYSDIPVVSPDKISNYGKNINILIAVRKYKYTVTGQLLELGFKNLYYAEFGYEVDLINTFSAHREYFKSIIDENSSKIEVARKLFTEPKSIEVFNAAIDAFGNGNWERLEATCEPEYSIMPTDILPRGEHEVLVECGAFNGGSVDLFMSEVDYKYDKAYAFEPNEPEFEALESKYSSNDKVEVHRLAICDTDGFVNFGGDNTVASANISEGEGDTPSTKLDSFFVGSDKQIPTLIRMDIEGAEISALHGSKKLIREHLPNLCISAYHRITDYWEVPMLIAELGGDPGYELYMRHYFSWFDTMCFAKRKALSQ